ncbi:MAG: DUF3127 domain-containing protein [Bacteroidales bacterium]|jgi:hypothetical protein|nr:DUF3127 domain-containing protein [Bacteroidales bacterium]
MEIKGKLVRKLPLQTGQGRNGEWKRQDIILELEGSFPRKVCISVWNDKANVAALSEGDVLTASVDIESREFNDKWYTSVTAWKIDVAGENQPLPDTTASSSPAAPTETYQPDASAENQPDDLPF